jgi:5-methylthioadenosine/S-adenosylhomocysteine deaminase
MEDPKEDGQPNARQHIDNRSEKHHSRQEVTQNTLYDVDKVSDRENRQQDHSYQCQERRALEVHPRSIIPAMRQTINRRGFMGSLAAVAATRFIEPAYSAPLPARGELIVRNGYIMTMDPELGDISGGDLHIKNGEIVAAGKAITAPGATVLDGRRMIVLPGLVETHWHMWNTLLRSFGGEKPDQGYFPTAAAYGQLMTPEDMYRGTRLAAAEALNCGMTTVHDYCHNLRSRAHADADVRALGESGLRARWSYGWPQGLPDTQVCNLDDLRALHKDWASFSNDGLISLGFAWRGMFRNSPLPREVYRSEFEMARRLGLPISLHVGSREDATGQIEALAKENLLGKDVQAIHALSASPAEIQMLAKAGSQVSVSPGTELRIGYGFTKIAEFLDAGVPLGVSVDTTVLSGDANLFGILKMARNIENARAHDEFKMSARRALELGTIAGARSLAIDDRVGSLKPGKRADVIMISADRLNMGVFTDAAHMVIESTQPENVDTVIVDGRILKRGGKLTGLDAAQVVTEAAVSFDALRKRAHLR